MSGFDILIQKFEEKMNKINTIFTTISGGQVHIATDTKYIGSVNSYNNCFTQIFAWLFRLSMTVNFDGKIRSVNKKSYANLIRSLTLNDRINNIRQYNMFRPVVESAMLSPSNLRMRNVITKEDRQELFRKLAIAISQGNTAKSLLLIGKGAELDTAYYDRDFLSPSFSTDTEGLGASRYTFTVYYASPILQAARKGNFAVVKFLQEAGANLSVSGKQYNFKREITGVFTRPNLELRPMLIPHHYHTRDLQGRCHDHVDYRTEYRPQLCEQTVVNTQDSRCDERIVYLL
jgi:hypothetical protein